MFIKMRPLLWLQLLLVSLSTREILGGAVPTKSTTPAPTKSTTPAPTESTTPAQTEPTTSAPTESTTPAVVATPDGKSADIDSIPNKLILEPKMEDQKASAMLVPSAADGTTNAPITYIDIESADPIPLTNKKRFTDSEIFVADGESANKVERKYVLADPKQREYIELIDNARVSRQEEASTTPQPQSTVDQPTDPQKRQSLTDSSESIESLPVDAINGIGDASATAYFTGDPKRRVSLSHDEFSQMLSQVLKENQMYGNVQQDPMQPPLLPPYLRPLQVEKISDSDRNSDVYLDDGRQQQGFQLDDPRSNDGPIYISVPLNKDFQQFQTKPQKPSQGYQDMDLALTPTTKRSPVDPPTEDIHEQYQHQPSIKDWVKPPPPPPLVHSNPVVPANPPHPPVHSNPIVPADPPHPPVHSNPIVPADPPHPPVHSNPIVPADPPHPPVHSNPIVPADPPHPPVHPNPIVPADPPHPPVHPNPIVPADPPHPPVHSDPFVPADPPHPPVHSNPIVPPHPPADPVFPANPSPPPADEVIHVNPSVPHVPAKPMFHPTNRPGPRPPPASPAGHEHVLPPPNNGVPKPHSPNDVVIAVPTPRPNSSPTTNVTIPPSCPTLVEFLNASRSVWQGIAQAGGLQAGLGVFFQAAGKVISTLTQCAKAILAEIGALFYQGIVEKMMGQLDEKPSDNMDKKRQTESKNQTKRSSSSVNSKKGRRYKKQVTPAAAGSSVNGDFIEAEIEEMDLEAEDVVTPDPGNVRGRKEAEEEEHGPEPVLDSESESLLKVDNVEPGMY